MHRLLRKWCAELRSARSERTSSKDKKEPITWTSSAKSSPLRGAKTGSPSLPWPWWPSSSSCRSGRSARPKSAWCASASVSSGCASGSPIAFHGEAGYQADLLTTGLRFKLWPLSTPSRGIRSCRFPPARSASSSPRWARRCPSAPSRRSTSRSSATSRTSRAFVAGGGQKGVQRPVLSPGTVAAIHPVGFLVIAMNHVYGVPVAEEYVRSSCATRTGRGLPTRPSASTDDQLEVVRIEPRTASDGKIVDMIGIVTTLEGSPSPKGAMANRLGDFDDIAGLERTPKPRTATWSRRFSRARTRSTTTTRTSRPSSTTAAASACSTIRCSTAPTTSTRSWCRSSWCRCWSSTRGRWPWSRPMSASPPRTPPASTSSSARWCGPATAASGRSRCAPANTRSTRASTAWRSCRPSS